MTVSQAIHVTQSKAKRVDIRVNLAEHKLDRVVVLKRGPPAVIVTSPPPVENLIEDLNGFMRGSVSPDPDLDLKAPISDEPWDTAQCTLHE